MSSEFSNECDKVHIHMPHAKLCLVHVKSVQNTFFIDTFNIGLYIDRM